MHEFWNSFNEHFLRNIERISNSVLYSLKTVYENSSKTRMYKHTCSFLNYRYSPATMANCCINLKFLGIIHKIPQIFLALCHEKRVMVLSLRSFLNGPSGHYIVKTALAYCSWNTHLVGAWVFCSNY